MPTLHTYDYSVVRVVPRVERAEFLNAGVVLSCPSVSLLAAGIELDGGASPHLCRISTSKRCNVISQRFPRSARDTPMPVRSRSCRSAHVSTG